MKKKLLAMLLVLGMAATLLCSCGKGYDYAANDLSAFIKLPDDVLTRDYSADVTLKSVPTDADVEEEIASTLKKYGEETIVSDGAVEDGDCLTIDYEGKIDGTAFEGGTATDAEHDVDLEQSTFIDGFDKGMIGMKAGETKDITCTFPTPYENNPDLAGKEAVFTVTVKEIKRTTAPELTKELMEAHASDFGDETDPAAYRKTVKDNLLEENKQSNLTAAKKAIWNYVLGNAEITSYPEEELKEQTKSLEYYYEHTEAAKDNLHMKDYVKKQGYESVAAFRDAVIVPEVKSDIAKRLALYSLAKLTDTAVTEAEAKEQAKKDFNDNVKPMLSLYSQYLGVSDLQSYIDYVGGISGIRESMIYNQALEVVAKKIPGVEIGE